MVALHIVLCVDPGRAQELEALYRDRYLPAIRIQPGFREARLLQHRDAPDRFEIDIAFESEDLRVRWANSPEHAAVWPLVEALGRPAWDGFDVVADDRV